MLHAAAPLEVGASSPAHHRCLLRDVGGLGALPASTSTSAVFGDDAATTRFLLERILRGSGTASSSSSAADVDPAEREDAAETASASVPSTQDRGEGSFLASSEGIAPLPSPASSSSSSAAEQREDAADPASGSVEASGEGSPPATDLHRPLEATASASVSRLAGVLGPGVRVIIVANRLPVTAKRVKGEWEFVESSGGLVSALRGVTEVQMTWVGWPGVSVPDKEDQTLITNELKKMRCIPVFLEDDLMDQYYNGYCNNILWPLFHYIALPQSCKVKKDKDFKSELKAYDDANRIFADAVRTIYKEGDVVWCHDYHLMLLPVLLKEFNTNMKVGWFLHTPFPSPEVYRALPNRMELLQAVLKADLVGFHTYDYARHFVSACRSLLGLESCLQGVEFEGRIVKIDAFPIGINSKRFKDALELPDVEDKIAEFKKLFAGRKVLLGVDRFDMIKGLLQKVLAFEKFLEENNDWIDKVVLLQIAVPTRSEVTEYRKLASQVHELVGRVNGRFGTLKTTPIYHLDQTFSFPTLCALYAITDVALVTSLRDGMNLVSYEYVACQESSKGVLILSEFAGAAQSLGAGAIIVNPWDVVEVAKSIKSALVMPAHEREKRHRDNYKLVTAHSAQSWAEEFICELHNTIKKTLIQTKQPVVVLPIKETAARYARSTRRLLIFGFNGTLTEQVQPFERGATNQTANAKLKLNPELKGSLKTLCDNEDTTVIVVSGYGKNVLDESFGEFKMWLAAENGMFLRQTGKEWMIPTSEQLETGCSHSVKKVIEYFTRRTPSSYSEHRETAFVWNYKYADDDFGRNQAKDMLHHLRAYSSSNQSADIVQGHRSIEVRPVGVTKANAVNRIIRELGRQDIISTPINFVLCIGHFLAKDEDVYSLPCFAESKGQAKRWEADCASIKFDVKAENYFSCTVGRERSLAQYKLEGTMDVASLLHDLSDTIEHAGSQL